MKAAEYPCPLPGGAAAREYALTFDAAREKRVLIAPALFEEGHKLRRFTLEVMRRLDGAGIDCFLPDLPGCNESSQDLALIEPEDWRMALEAAARHFEATHILAIRGGGLVLPARLGGWHYAPVKGASLLKTMLRARIIAAREAGREETIDALMEQGLQMGIDLAGYSLSGEMLRQMGELLPGKQTGISVIEHELIGGSALWLRAEADEDAQQADALAAVIAIGLSA
ncbi:MAG: hypothetical protein ABL914_06635 [Novosphingobium sp.]|uniref:hypothetical protein n=1 Tax=Novosphingobium sp. TaxID=1874826 RepID=UPI0032BC9F8D